MVRGWLSVRACLIALVVGLALLWRSPVARVPPSQASEPLDNVCVNELFPVPCGGTVIDDEFIELYNPTGGTADIGGWAVRVMRWTQLVGHYTFPAGTTLAAGGFRVVWCSEAGLTLPETGASVVLWDQAGEEVGRFTYASAACDLALGRIPDGSDNWEEGLAPSPGGPNVFATVTPSPTASSTPTSTPTPSPTATRTPTATSTPKPTRTSTSTSTPKPTRTPTASRTPSVTASATPIPTATPTSTPTATPTPLIPCSVCLSEFLPAPGSEIDWDGDGNANHYDEWIELYNNLDRDLNLAGWALDDAAGSGSYPYLFPEGTVLGAGEYRAFFWRTTTVTLNNDGDMVRLLAPNGEAVEAATYTATEYDIAHSRRSPCGGPWLMNWQPTPGEANALTLCPPPCNGGWPAYLPLVWR